MSKLIKTLTLGVAAGALVVASSSAFAWCPRDNNGYHKTGYYGYSKQVSHDYNSYSSYKTNADYSVIDDDDADDVEEADMDDADDDEDDDEVVVAPSQVFQVTAATDCDVEGCDVILVRDANGFETEIGDVEFDDELVEGASEEALMGRLIRSGTAVRASIIEETDEEDGEIYYSLVVEQIYS